MSACIGVLALCGSAIGCDDGGRLPFPPSPPGPQASLFEHLRKHGVGPLLLDEVSGSFAGIHLGLTISEAKKRLPSEFHWTQPTDEIGLAYCSEWTNSDCRGPAIYLTALNLDRTNAIDQIAITTTRDSFEHGRLPEGKSVRTLHGVHLGSSLPDLERRYQIAFRQPVCATLPPGGTYYAYAGPNLVAFCVHRNLVEQIIVFRGHQYRC